MYRYTLFNTPVITDIFYLVALLLLRISGWKIRGAPPQHGKFIIIAYPHTSNWDMPYTIAINLALRLEIYWMGKSSLFIGPMGPVMKWLGGIPIQMDKSQNVVDRSIEMFLNSDELVIVIAPEANRAYVNRWKSGFYHIAHGAGVPIALGFLDFSKKEGGYLNTIIPIGDFDLDTAMIKTQYAGIKGKHPDQSD